MADASRMAELRERSNAVQAREKIRAAIEEVEAGEQLAELDLDHEGAEAFRGMRRTSLLKLYADLGSNNERIRQAAYLRVLEMTDGKPGQRDERDEPTEIVFRTEAIPADGTIRHEKPPGPDPEDRLVFEL